MPPNFWDQSGALQLANSFDFWNDWWKWPWLKREFKRVVLMDLSIQFRANTGKLLFWAIYSQMSRSQEIQLRMSLQVPLRRQSRTGWLVGMPSEVALRNLSSDSSRVFNMFKCRSKLGMSNYAKNHGHCLQFPSSIIELTGCVSPHSYPGLHKHGELVVSVGHILAALRVQKELATELVEKNPCS